MTSSKEIPGSGNDQPYIHESIRKIEIQRTPENTLKIELSSTQYAELFEILEAFQSLQERRLNDLQGTLNYVFSEVIKKSPNYVKENLDALKFFNECLLTLGQSNELFMVLHTAFARQIEKDNA